MPDREATIEVYGTPRPQGSKTGFVVKPKGGGAPRAVVAEAGSKKSRAAHADWRKAIAQAARDWADDHDPFPPLDGPVFVSIMFRLSKPTSYPRWRWLPATKPDLDKLIRSVLDGVKGPLLMEDSRVVALAVAETFVTERAPGATIYMREVTEAERAGRLSVPGFTIMRDTDPDPHGVKHPNVDEPPRLPLPE